MRRPGRSKKSSLGISLFPFLAVLLCTMGSLIVLLICLVQQTDLSSPAKPDREPQAAAAPAADPERRRELEYALDDADFLNQQLKQKREELSKSLEATRDEMSIAERILRDQEDEVKLLQSQLVAIRQGGANEEAHDAAKELADEAKREIAKLEETLRAKEKEQKDRPKRVSIVPYRGKNGTTQRPIYVECTSESVIIQPEGIEFSAVDFLAAKSAGNPLDASLRAVREYFAQKKAENGGETPYPLFIVRPGGEIAYLSARAAIVSWEDEFGYELIDDSVELEYPSPDPKLGQVVKRAANDARKRQEALAQALPGQFRGVATATAAGEAAPRNQSGGNGLGGGNAVAARGMGFGSGAGGPGKGSLGGSDSRYVDGVAPKFGAASRYSEQASAEGGEKKEGQKPIRHGSKKAGEKDGAPGGKGGGAPDAMAAAAEIQRRGKNWAHKGAESAIEVPVARTISVRCTGKEIVFIPPKGSVGKPIAIEWADDPIQVVDSIALQVRNRIQSWGMAIGGGHWQPILDVEVGEGGEERFADLQAFFDQSGIEVRRKSR